MAFGFGGSTPATSNTSANAWQLPYQQYGQNQNLAQYQNTNTLVAPFAPQQEQALTNIGNMSQNGGPATQIAANNYVTHTLNGNPASNPYLDSMFHQGANQVQNQLSSEFAGSGRNIIGSLPVQSDMMNNLASQLYGGQYATGVQQQENALGNANATTQQAYNNQNNLFGAGQQVQNLSNQYIQAPQNFLNQYLSRANNSLGQTSTQSPAFNSGAGALGGALVGGGIGSSLGSAFGGSSGGNWGNLLGSLAGGLLGGGG